MSPKAVAFSAAAALLLAGVVVWLFNQKQETPEQALSSYLSAWNESDYDTMEEMLFRDAVGFREVHEQALDDLRATEVLAESLSISEDGPSASANFRITWKLEGAGDWTYDSVLELEELEGQWLVVWSPAAIHPNLTSGGTGFERTRTWPERGKLLTADDEPITDDRRVVVVGIQPDRVTDRGAMIEALVTNVGADPAKVNADLDQPGLRGDWFLPVTELAAEQYEVVRPVIHPVPGLVFQSRQQRLPPTPDFAQHVLGRTGAITAELLDKLGEPYESTDQVGLTGLEAVYERRLAGRPSVEISLPGNEEAGVVHRVEGEPGRPVKTTLSLSVQSAAEAALAGIDKKAAIVAVDIATSEIRGVVSRPLNEFNRALSGRYAPGSSFKIVTAAGLLSSGVEPQESVSCPATVKVGGRSFKNFEGEQFGDISFKQAFVHSCNTAFIGLSSSVEQDTVEQAAVNFGFNRDYDLPLNAGGGSYPEPKDATERAAASIGQGKVLASPMHMATVAGAAASSGWKPPKLLADGEEPEVEAIDPIVAQQLREMMVAAVAEGTGTGAQLPGVEVGGKTGTAEFGEQTPPRTHAWFVGYSRTLAFAVVVEDGGVGGQVAAPIAARFLAGLS